MTARLAALLLLVSCDQPVRPPDVLRECVEFDYRTELDGRPSSCRILWCQDGHSQTSVGGPAVLACWPIKTDRDDAGQPLRPDAGQPDVGPPLDGGLQPGWLRQSIRCPDGMGEVLSCYGRVCYVTGCTPATIIVR